MGNEESTSSDNIYKSPQRPRTLEAKDLRSVAKYMKSDKCENIFVMVRSVSPTMLCNV
jgi:hypothetical protein